MKNIRGYIEHIRESGLGHDSRKAFIEAVKREDLRKALIKAVRNKDFHQCKKIIDAGAEVNTNIDWMGVTLLSFALYSQSPDIAKLLIDAGAEVNAESNLGRYAIHIAVANGYYDVVKRLIEAGANIDLKNFENQTPLDMALSNRRRLPDGIHIAKLLIQAGAEIDLKAKFGTFKEFSDSFGGDIKWIPRDLIPPEWRDSAKFTGTFGGFY
jgi:ankyrin repeat protein